MSDDTTRNLVDKSGFAFQLAIESEVRAAQSRFRVLATEHGWHNARTGDSGFIDVVLHDDSMPDIRLVVECKRHLGAHWAFLCPDESQKLSANRWRDTPERLQQKVIARWTGVSKTTKARATDGFLCSPVSEYSSFSTLHGHAEGQTPMLERVAGELVLATEAIADEQMAIDIAQRSANPAFRSTVFVYVPVIVTTARLTACKFKPADVSVADGKLPQTSTFADVPFVRFVKNLSHDYDVTDHATLASANAAKDRTVFIVNGERFGEFLRKFDVTGNTPDAIYTLMRS
jgi:hypothetical protein